MKKTLKTIAVLITCTLLSFLLAEVTSRAFIFFRVVKLDKNILSLYRGATVPLPSVVPKKTGSIRIFTYGGSTTEGAHLPKIGYVEQLRVQLEHALKSAIDVQNFGFSAFNSTDDRFLVERTIGLQPDIIVVYTSHNEFIFREALSYYSYILNKVDVLAFPKVAAVFSEKIFKRTPQFKIEESNNHDKKYYAEKLNIFMQNMDAISKICNSQKIPCLFVTAVSNFSDWLPSGEETLFSDESLYEFQNDVKKLEEMDIQSGEALQILADKFVNKYPESAKIRFLRGKIFQKMNNFSKAREDFKVAKDRDAVPWRALSIFNEYVRSLEDGEYIFIADAEKYLEKEADNGMIGYEYIIDNVHPTTLGKFNIAMTILKTLKEKVIIPNEVWKEQVSFLNLNEMTSAIPMTEEDLYNELNLTIKYSLKPPFLNYERAQKLLSDALVMRRDDWSVWANLATISLAQGDMKKAEENLKEAAQIYGKPLNLEDHQNIPTLGYIYKQRKEVVNVLGAYIDIDTMSDKQE